MHELEEPVANPGTIIGTWFSALLVYLQRSFTVRNISGSLTCAVASSFVCTSPLAVITVTRVVLLTRSPLLLNLNLFYSTCAKIDSDSEQPIHIALQESFKGSHVSQPSPYRHQPHPIECVGVIHNQIGFHLIIRSTLLAKKKQFLRTNASQTATSVPPTTCFVHTYEESHHLLLTPSQTVDSTTSTI